MLDVFAFLLPLVMMVLWFAVQNRTKQGDEDGEAPAGVMYPTKEESFFFSYYLYSLWFIKNTFQVLANQYCTLSSHHAYTWDTRKHCLPHWSSNLDSYPGLCSALPCPSEPDYMYRLWSALWIAVCEWGVYSTAWLCINLLLVCCSHLHCISGTTLLQKVWALPAFPYHSPSSLLSPPTSPNTLISISLLDLEMRSLPW